MERNSSGRKNRIRRLLLPGILLLLTALNCVSLAGEFPRKVSLYRFGFGNQTMYHPVFLEEGRYPDVLIREIIRDRTVKLNCEFKPYGSYIYGGDPIWLYRWIYHKDNNYGYFFREYAGECLRDESLPRPYTVSHSSVYGHREELFTDIGNTNDMLRYVFAANFDTDRVPGTFYRNTYFHYMWFYHYARQEIRGFAALEDLTDIPETEPLVAFWDQKETLYFMSEDYYKQHVSDLIYGMNHAD